MDFAIELPRIGCKARDDCMTIISIIVKHEALMSNKFLMKCQILFLKSFLAKLFIRLDQNRSWSDITRDFCHWQLEERTHTK